MSPLMTAFRFLFIVAVVAFSVSAHAGGDDGFPIFDRGPDPENAMQRELVDILQEMPYVPGISEKLQVLTPKYRRGQKTRLDFGAMPVRGFLTPNSISVLVIGQDGTHIAEAANRPGIAGFGGRVQDMLMHFGIFEGVLFTNLYVNTISGQYGSRNTPMIQNRNGKNKLVYRNLIENRLWLMTHEGPYGKWRNRFLSWVIRNNQKSLKMVMMLGNAGRDAGASFIKSIGGNVGTQTSERVAKSLKIPQIKMVSAGGNNEWAVPVNADGKDIAEVLLGRELKYNKTQDQNAAKKVISENLEEAMKMMVFSNSGPLKNGVLSTVQLGGYDLERMRDADGKKTRSIRGLKIPDGKGGSIDAPDIVFVHAPHPTSLSMTEQQNRGSAAPRVEKSLIKPLREAQEAGWEPPQPEEGLESPFLKGTPYKYGRAVIPQSHGDPGITDLRLLPVSTASRMGRNVIIIGTRDRSVKFERGLIRKMGKEKAAKRMPEAGRVLTGRPQFDDWLYKYDRGPSKEMAELLFNSIDLKKVFRAKRGKSWRNDGIEAYNVKSHPDAGAFGHYRGTFENPRVLILADPHGYDSIITSKALTGNRGQFIHGLMENIKVNEDYLVLKTVPFAMDGATAEEWEKVLDQTAGYREELINAVLANGTPDLILTDGSIAAAEMNRILGESDIPVVNIERGKSAESGIKEAGAEIKKITGFKRSRISGKRSDIPREHLTWIARVWEGTSGDRVITAEGKKHKGLAFAIVAPDWARDHKKVKLQRKTQRGVNQLIKKLEESGDPMPGEKLKDFLERQSESISQ